MSSWPWKLECATSSCRMGVEAEGLWLQNVLWEGRQRQLGNGAHKGKGWPCWHHHGGQEKAPLAQKPASEQLPSQPPAYPMTRPTWGCLEHLQKFLGQPSVQPGLVIRQEWFSSQRLLFRGPLGMLPRPLATGEVFKPDLPSASLCQSLNPSGGVNVWTQRFREHNFIHLRCQSSIIYEGVLQGLTTHTKQFRGVWPPNSCC